MSRTRLKAPYRRPKLKRDRRTGVVTIDEKTKRKEKGTSEELATKLNEVGKDVDVKILPTAGTKRWIESPLG